MSVNSGLQATKITGQRKAFYRQRIPESSRLQHMRHTIARTCLCRCLKHWRRTKKACLVWLRKLQGVWHITRLKQQRSLSFTFCKTQKSYKEIMRIYFIDSVVKIVLSEAATRGVLYKKVFLKSAKSTGKHLCQILFFNKFAVAAVVFTYPLNLVLPKENLESTCKR